MTQEKTRLIRLPEVRKMTGLSRSAIYRNMDERGFPLSIKLGPQTIAWVESEVQDWINQQVRTARQDPRDQVRNIHWPAPG